VRFSVYANPEGPDDLIDVQANLLSHLNTRVVVPLLPKKPGTSAGSEMGLGL
jgi:toxin CcdB